jgi:PadR family transcriptional regulator
MGRSYLSYTATVILQTIASGYAYGFEIMDLTGLPSGTVYPALRRLEDWALLDSRWEKHQIAHDELRPRRKYYEVTALGAKMLADAVARYRLLDRQVPTKPARPSRVLG